MLTHERKIMYVAIALLCFAALACVAETRFIRFHDFEQGLSSWKYSINNLTEQETRYAYDENGDLVAIEFYFKGKPDFVASYLKYLSVTDSTGKEVKYRLCVNRIGYNEKTGQKAWEDSTEVVIINGMPKIKTMTTRNGDGALRYRDVYEYDEMGRKVSAIRTLADNTTLKHEYSYEGRKNLGVVREEYYFETPRVYYNRSQYLEWRTLATETIPIVQIPTFPR